ncbi:MAG TPA: acyltransferase [Tepidisphaeraceae bacterium]
MSAGPISVLSVESLRPAAATVATREGATTRPAADRLALLDTVRLVAAVGIVWVHAAQSDVGKWFWPIGTFGVPFYTFVAVLFMTRSLTKPGGRSLTEYAVSRATRVYLPFLFWTAVYVALSQAKSIVRDHTMNLPSPTVLYVGGHEHLWFLPFLMIVTLGGALLVKGVQGLPAARWPVVCLLAVLGVVAAVLPEPRWVAAREHDMDFWRYTLRATPTVCWALALGLACAFHGKLPRTTPLLAVGGIVLLLGSMTLQETITPFKVLRSTAGLGCVLIALLPLALPALRSVGSLGRYSYGIYLSHLVFLRIAAAWMERWETTPTLATDAACFGFAFVSASLLSLLLAKSPWTRWTLGE